MGSAPFETGAGPLSCTVCGYDRFDVERFGVFGLVVLAGKRRLRQVECVRCHAVHWFR